MKKTTFSRVLLGCITFAFLNAGASAQQQARYTRQYQNSLRLIQNNLQPSGGVIAAPSTQPYYLYDWVRDTSLTMKTLIQIAYDPKTNAATAQKLQAQVDRWVNWELGLQTTPKNFPHATDLGEPRFFLSGLVNDENWARPQNDGPAARAIAAISLANLWLKHGRTSDVKTRLYNAELPAQTLIKRDLEYVAHHWSDQSYDLWEEEFAMHFYTLTMQKVSMIKGSALARTLGDAGAADFYAQQATAIGNYLNQFYDPSQNLIRYAVKRDSFFRKPEKTTDFDVAVLLAAVQTFDGQFYVPVAQMVATVNQLMAQFQSAYAINKILVDPHTKAPLGVAIGRYPHDIYSGSGSGFDGGNPWFLSTLALGEFACDLKKVNFKAASGLGSSVAELDQVKEAQFNRVLYHTDSSGAMSEQFNRDVGYEMSAPNLTWSYTSYLSAYRACF